MTKLFLVDICNLWLLRAGSHGITCMLGHYFCGGFLHAQKRLSCRYLHAKRVMLRSILACKKEKFLANTCILARLSGGGALDSG